MAHTKLDLELLYESHTPQNAADFLASRSGLSKMRIKDAMNKGALKLKRGGSPYERLRKATFLLRHGDRLAFHYDDEILGRVVEKAACLSDQGRYSVWTKPVGVLSQGNDYGDHCSLLRQAELHFGMKRKVYPVHRLDREVSGLVLVAHTPAAARALSELFRTHRVEKKYRAEVCGDIAAGGPAGRIAFALDGKPAVTHFGVVSFDPTSNSSKVEVSIETGRLHQIRRHFAMAGFPVCGDPKYGSGNKNTEGMKLAAVSLRFVCPFSRKEVVFRKD